MRIDSFWSNGKKKSTFFGEGAVSFADFLFHRFLWRIERSRDFAVLVLFWLGCFICFLWIVGCWFVRFGLVSSSLVVERTWIG